MALFQIFRGFVEKSNAREGIIDTDIFRDLNGLIKNALKGFQRNPTRGGDHTRLEILGQIIVQVLRQSRRHRRERSCRVWRSSQQVLLQLLWQETIPKGEAHFCGVVVNADPRAGVCIFENAERASTFVVTADVCVLEKAQKTSTFALQQYGTMQQYPGRL